MSDLSELGRPEGAHRATRRRGRGPGSGIGKTCGRGHKGHKARTGGTTHPWFEGGQMPLQRRLPKRGFTNPFRTEYEVLNVGALDALDDDVIDPAILQRRGMVDPSGRRPLKILGQGEVTKKLRVSAHAVSSGARAKIEAAGGTVELLER